MTRHPGGDAYTYGKFEFRLIRKRDFGNFVSYSFSHDLPVLWGGVFDKRRKFFPAITAQKLVFPHNLPKSGRCLHQYLVAEGMTKGVVYLLEMIDIHEHDAA